jgi:hypothetical protein
MMPGANGLPVRSPPDRQRAARRRGRDASPLRAAAVEDAPAARANPVHRGPPDAQRPAGTGTARVSKPRAAAMPGPVGAMRAPTRAPSHAHGPARASPKRTCSRRS